METQRRRTAVEGEQGKVGGATEALVPAGQGQGSWNSPPLRGGWSTGPWSGPSPLSPCLSAPRAQPEAVACDALCTMCSAGRGGVLRPAGPPDTFPADHVPAI